MGKFLQRLPNACAQAAMASLEAERCEIQRDLRNLQAGAASESESAVKDISPADAVGRVVRPSGAKIELKSDVEAAPVASANTTRRGGKDQSMPQCVIENLKLPLKTQRK